MQWTLLKFTLVFCYRDSFLSVQFLYVERAMQWIGHPKKLISLFERLFNGCQWLVAGRTMCTKHFKGARSLQELASKALRTWSCHNALSKQPIYEFLGLLWLIRHQIWWVTKFSDLFCDDCGDNFGVSPNLVTFCASFFVRFLVNHHIWWCIQWSILWLTLWHIWWNKNHHFPHFFFRQIYWNPGFITKFGDEYFTFLVTILNIK